LIDKLAAHPSSNQIHGELDIGLLDHFEVWEIKLRLLILVDVGICVSFIQSTFLWLKFTSYTTVISKVLSIFPLLIVPTILLLIVVVASQKSFSLTILTSQV